MNDEIARTLGFESASEFFSLVSSRDISTPEKLAAFRGWQDEDGTKAGILLLPARGEPPPDGLRVKDGAGERVARGGGMNEERIYWISDVQLAAQHLPDPAIARRAGKMEYVVSVPVTRELVPVTGDLLPFGPSIRTITVLFRLVAWRRGNEPEHWRWEVAGRVVLGELPN